jgi:hypothetical protein
MLGTSDLAACDVIMELVSHLSAKAADTLALERKIDRMVYELYGLTDEAIRTLEGSS